MVRCEKTLVDVESTNEWRGKKRETEWPICLHQSPLYQSFAESISKPGLGQSQLLPDSELELWLELPVEVAEHSLTERLLCMASI